MFDIAGNKICVFFGNSYFIEHNVFRVRKYAIIGCQSFFRTDRLEKSAIPR